MHHKHKSLKILQIFLAELFQCFAWFALCLPCRPSTPHAPAGGATWYLTLRVSVRRWYSAISCSSSWLWFSFSSPWLISRSSFWNSRSSGLFVCSSSSWSRKNRKPEWPCGWKIFRWLSSAVSDANGGCEDVWALNRSVHARSQPSHAGFQVI